MFDERFIDREIGELCMEYDKIKGANTNIQRISPSLIDGLKPVQRRALFVMFDKDGGRTFHKLATISGDVFGKVHPHCLHGDTEFMLTNGETVSIKELYERDQKEFKIISYDATRDAIVTSIMHDVRITKYVSFLTKVTFSNGGVIHCTNDHRLLVVRDGNAVMVEAQKLNIGDTMYPEINNITVSDISGVLHHDKIPVYDFTADPCHNGMVFCGDKNNPDKCAGIIVSNSPVAIEDAIVNIAQSWHNNIPLIEGQGNFGSIAGDPAGASRYIKARLSDYAYACFFEDWKDSVVDTTLAYDEETKMPDYLPAKYPNVLLNGCLGIG